MPGSSSHASSRSRATTISSDIQAYRDRAFSSLHLIEEEAFRRGISRLEADLARGPIPCVSLYTMIWGSVANVYGRCRNRVISSV